MRFTRIAIGSLKHYEESTNLRSSNSTIHFSVKPSIWSALQTYESDSEKNKKKYIPSKTSFLNQVIFTHVLNKFIAKH
jgi:hypothetical protein